MDEAKRARELIARVARALTDHTRKGKLLEHIAWPRAVEERFFAASASRLPEVEYSVDRVGIEASVAELSAAAKTIDGDDAVAVWLRRILAAQIDADRLLLAAGTPEFSALSRELYGGART